jgi:uncharacterized damage-inducible protein DinB
MPRTSLAVAALALVLVPTHTARAQADAATQKTAQQLDMEGLWRGYDGEWHHTTYQLLALAEAIPEKDYAWRPAPGVRSTSEVIMHIAIANFGLLSITGIGMPPDLKQDAEKTVTSKADVITWLKRSLEAVRLAHLKETPKHLATKVPVHFDYYHATVDGMYLRIIVHANEHMGQLIAYARMNNVVPPWSGN